MDEKAEQGKPDSACEGGLMLKAQRRKGRLGKAASRAA